MKSWGSSQQAESSREELGHKPGSPFSVACCWVGGHHEVLLFYPGSHLKSFGKSCSTNSQMKIWDFGHFLVGKYLIGNIPWHAFIWHTACPSLKILLIVSANASCEGGYFWLQSLTCVSFCLKQRMGVGLLLHGTEVTCWDCLCVLLPLMAEHGWERLE